MCRRSLRAIPEDDRPERIRYPVNAFSKRRFLVSCELNAGMSKALFVMAAFLAAIL